ncbi:MAG TPA: ABC transporter permease subunit, partial [Smithellaceae bacterium]|nr:ABC transporter permease subunit [Smithellaceae bacterium]
VGVREMIRHTSGITYLRKWLCANEYAFAFSPNQVRLQGQVNAALQEMKKDGTLSRLEAKWFGADDTVKVLPDYKLEGKNGVIRFATNSDSVPFVYVKNGKLVGYDIEVATIIAGKLGRKLEIMDMDFAAIIPSLVSGKTDMAGAFISVTKERAQSVLFSVPNYSGGTVVVVATAAGAREADTIYDISQLAGKKVGILTGSVYDGVLKSRISGALPEYFNTVADQVEAVKSGKIAGFLVDEPLARDIINNTAGVTTLNKTLTSDGYAFAFAKDRTELHSQFDAALKEMRDDGTLQKIDARWFGKEDTVKVLPDLMPAGKNGVIRLATNSNMAPFAYIKHGKMVGYDIEIAMRIAAKLGHTLEIVDMDFAAIIPSLISGKSDMAAGGITMTPERARSVLFSIPDYKGGVVVMVASGADTPGSPGGTSFRSALMNSFQRTFITEDRYKLVLQGLWVTIVISVLSAIIGAGLGFGVCMMRRARTRWANVPAKVFIRAIQGTPIVVLLMILYYIVFGSVDINAILVAVVGFSVNFAAYVSEMMRTGIEAVDKGQQEAAYAIGFNKIQVFRRITFPQAARHVLPV